MWRYILQSLPSGEFLHWNLPLSGVSITRTLSGPGALSGSLAESAEFLGPDGKPLIQPWGCAIWAEADGEIRGGGIVADVSYSGSTASIECLGISGYPQGLPWTEDEYKGVQVDPLNVFRRIWNYVQSFPDSDLGVQVDDTTSPVRIGTAESEEASAGEESGPFLLNYWETEDLGAVVDDLTTSTPFDYLEHTSWDGEELSHRIELGHPTIGSRRVDRFVVGENVSLLPSITVEGEDFASEVMVLGAGEGRKMVRAHLSKPTNRLRRVAVVPDKAARSQKAATETARTELAWRVGADEITDLTVIQHPNIDVHAITPGDSIRVQGDLPWVQLDQWVRVTEITMTPEATNVVRLTVVAD